MGPLASGSLALGRDLMHYLLHAGLLHLPVVLHLAQVQPGQQGALLQRVLQEGTDGPPAAARAAQPYELGQEFVTA